jgi:hypothetical protein
MEGLDNDFVNYGIRHDDLMTIEALCQREEIDFEWLKEDVLREYHNKKSQAIDITDSETEAVINKALQDL